LEIRYLKYPIQSPTFASWRSVSARICIFRYELDLLCGEYEIVAEKAASHNSGHGLGTEIVRKKNAVKWAKIVRIDRQALQLWKTVLGKDHPYTLTSIRNLAFTIRWRSKYREAETV
jgi:hypothetical protein